MFNHITFILFNNIHFSPSTVEPQAWKYGLLIAWPCCTIFSDLEDFALCNCLIYMVPIVSYGRPTFNQVTMFMGTAQSENEPFGSATT